MGARAHGLHRARAASQPCLAGRQRGRLARPPGTLDPQRLADPEQRHDRGPPQRQADVPAAHHPGHRRHPHQRAGARLQRMPGRRPVLLAPRQPTRGTAPPQPRRLPDGDETRHHARDPRSHPGCPDPAQGRRLPASRRHPPAHLPPLPELPHPGRDRPARPRRPGRPARRGRVPRPRPAQRHRPRHMRHPTSSTSWPTPYVPCRSSDTCTSRCCPNT